MLRAIVLCLLALSLAGCPKQRPMLDPAGIVPDAVTGEGGAVVTDPAPLPSPFTLTKNSRALTVQPVALPTSGEVAIPIEASEAILALSRTGEAAAGFGFDFEGASTTATGMPRLQSLPPAPGPACGTFDLPRASLGTMPAPSGMRVMTTSAPPTVGTRRDFIVRNTSVTAVCLAVGPHAAIWVDEQDRYRYSLQELEGLNARFEALLPEITERYGPAPAGRPDGYNGGHDQLNVLITHRVPEEYGAFMEPLDFFPDSIVQQKYGKTSNYAKVLYLNSVFGSGHFLNSMIHEYVHLIFFGQRLEAYSRNHGAGLPLGQDPSYFDSADLSERWLNEGLAVLSEYLFSPSLLTTYVPFLDRYLRKPSSYDMAVFQGAPESEPPNYGGALLFAAYAHDRHAAFIKELPQASGVSTAAVDEVMQRAGTSFSELYRDYALSLLLDGYHPDVPPRYGIPHLDVYGGFGGPPTESLTSSTEPPLPNGVRYVHVRFDTGKGTLRIRNAAAMKGTLLLFRPAASPGIVSP